MKEFDFSAVDTAAAMAKYDRLLGIIRECGSALIAFSGGVDSSFLAAAARAALGDKVVLATAVSETFPEHEREVSKKFAREIGVEQIFIKSNELDNDKFRKNPRNRCYYCKKELFAKLAEKALELGLKKVLSGANYDDIGDFRPGLEAQKELGVLSPLMEAGLTKLEIRFLSKQMGISSWSRPQMACLTSRFPYGVEFDREKFKAVESCEEFLRGLGFSQYRVRVHDKLARIEIETDEFGALLEHREKIAAEFKKKGFTFVALDIEGFRSGSFNL